MCQESGPSRDAKSHETWEPDWITERLSGFLTCSNASCHELVTFCGTSGKVLHGHDAEQTRETYTQQYRPVFFDPPVPLFPIHKDCPEEISQEVKKAFSLFWCDLESCANRIRSTVETILTDRKIPQRQRNAKRKTGKVNLHQRIDLFRKKNPELANYVMAVKWIGNAGSHSDTLQRTDVFDGFDLLEHVLIELYGPGMRALKNLAREVNKRSNPRSRKKRITKTAW